MELVIAGDLLDQRAVILEKHEEAQVVEQIGRRQYAMNQRFQFVELAQRVKRHAVDGAPLHETFAVRRQGAEPRFAAVRDHQQFVVLKDVGNLFFVGLYLVVGFPDICVLVGGIFQFEQHQRQAIDEEDDVRPARIVRSFDRVLINRQPFIVDWRVGRLGPVNQPNEIAPRLTVLLVLHRHAADQQLVELAIGREQNRDAEVKHLFECVFLGGGRDIRVQAMDGFAQAERQNDLPIIGTFRGRAIRRDVRAVAVRITGIGQPAERLLFEVVFGHGRESSNQRVSRSIYAW